MGKNRIFNAAASFNKLWNTKCYQNEPRFNGVYSRNNLPNKIKDEAYLINLDEYAHVGTHWIALFCRSEIIYFDSFGVQHVPERIKECVGNKKVIANIFRVQASNSIPWGYFCIRFINFMIANKKVTDFTSMCSPYGFEKNGNIILELFQRWMNLIPLKLIKKLDWSDKIQIKWNKQDWKLF